MSEYQNAVAGREPRSVFPFDLSLIWPLRLARPEEPGLIQNALRKAGWVQVSDTLRKEAEPEDDGYAYAEMVTFHPFVRRVLFGTPEDRPFDLFLSKLPANSAVHVDDNHAVSSLHVQEFRLYVFDDLLVLVTELAAQAPTTWDKMLNSVSYLRTLYFQHYYLTQSGSWIGGGAPRHLRFGDGDSDPSETLDRREEMRKAIAFRRPALLDHWHKLLKPVFHVGATIDDLGDYRMAVMALVGTPEPQSIDPDNWFRLSEADGAGFMPYAPPFRFRGLRNAVYDRWWNRDETHSHRYLVGPMTFATVMQCRMPQIPDWLVSFQKRWHRQYFDSYLVAHLQRARLMVLQDRLVGAATKLERGDTESARRQAETIAKDMAIFSSRYWFTELSPQIQQQEIFQQMRKQLGLDELYRGIIEDKRLLADWLVERQDEERSRLWDRVNRIYVPAGIVLAMASILVVPLAKGLIGPLGACIFSQPELIVSSSDMRELIAILVTALLFVPLFFIFRKIVHDLPLRNRGDEPRQHV